MNRPECLLGTGHCTRLFLWRQLDFIQSRRECAPVKTTAFRCSGKMARAELFIQAQLCGILQQERGAKVRTLDDVKPAHGFRQIERRFLGKARCSHGWNLKVQIDQILLDHGQTSAAFQIRQQSIKLFIGEEDVQITMEEILGFDELTETLFALEWLGGRDEFVQHFMRLSRRISQAFRTAFLHVTYTYCLCNTHIVSFTRPRLAAQIKIFPQIVKFISARFASLSVCFKITPSPTPNATKRRTRTNCASAFTDFFGFHVNVSLAPRQWNRAQTQEWHMSDSQQPARQHYWDPLRALLMMLGIPYHASLLYSQTIPWDIKSGETSTVLTVLGSIIVTFRMPAFFLVAGYFSLMMIEKKGCKTWLRSRSIRLGLPFVTALVLLAPPQLLLIELSHAAKGDISFEVAMVRAFEAVTHPNAHWIMHLWFLPTLLIYSGALAVLWRLCKTSAFLPLKTAYATISRAAPWLTLLLVCSAPIAWEMLVYGLAAMAQQSDNALFRLYDTGSDPYVRYSSFYLVGTLLYADKVLLRYFRQTGPLTILTACMAIAITLYLRWHPMTGSDAALLFASSIAAICITRCLLDYMNRHLDAPNGFVRNVTDASLTMYLLHHPLIYGLGTLFLFANFAPILEFSIIVLATTGLAYAAHRLIIRSEIALFLFNGASTQRPQVAAPARLSSGNNTLR